MCFTPLVILTRAQQQDRFRRALFPFVCKYCSAPHDPSPPLHQGATCGSCGRAREHCAIQIFCAQLQHEVAVPVAWALLERLCPPGAVLHVMQMEKDQTALQRNGNTKGVVWIFPSSFQAYDSIVATRNLNFFVSAQGHPETGESWCGVYDLRSIPQEQREEFCMQMTPSNVTGIPKRPLVAIPQKHHSGGALLPHAPPAFHFAPPPSVAGARIFHGAEQQVRPQQPQPQKASQPWRYEPYHPSGKVEIVLCPTTPPSDHGGISSPRKFPTIRAE